MTLGAWLETDKEANEEDIERLLEILREGQRNFVRVMVGSELLLRGDMRPGELMEYLERVRDGSYVPASTAP